MAGRSATSSRSRYLFLVGIGVAATVATIALLTVLAQPVIELSRATANRRQCTANLRKIGAALIAYEAQHGTLPPPYVVDADGNRLYSWRVLILPHLGSEEKALYEEFDLREAWDSTKNKPLSDRMPAVFRSPGDDQAKNDNETSYQVIVGRQTAFSGTKPVSLSQITDGTQHTILVVEVAGTGIVWSEPRDLQDGMLTYQIGVDIGGCHRRGANVLFASGDVRFLPDSSDSDVLRAMSTISGNEPLPDY